MTLWAYKGYESTYYGEHGMYMQGIISGTAKDAADAASEAAYDVMASYACLMEDLEAEADYYDESLEILMAEHACGKYCKIKDEITKMHSLQDLDNELDTLGYDEFIIKYGDN